MLELEQTYPVRTETSKRTVVQEVVFDDGVIRHGRVDQKVKGEWVVLIFRDDDVTSPCIIGVESSALHVLNDFVDGEWHTISRDSREKYHVRRGELSIHPVEPLDKLP
jgi:hypothetical protein